MSGDDSRTVCFCHNVTEQTLRNTVHTVLKKKGSCTLMDMQAETCASTGCGGCEFEVIGILTEELEKAGPAKGVATPSGR